MPSGSSTRPDPDPLGTFARCRLLGLQALVVAYSFAAAAFHSNPPSLAGEKEGIVRLAIAVAIAMLILSLRDRVGVAGRPPHSAALDVVLAYGAVACVEFILANRIPSLALVGWAPTQGGFVGIALLTLTRSLLLPSRGDPGSWDHEWYRRFCIVLSTLSCVGALTALTSAGRTTQWACAVVLTGSIVVLGGLLFARRLDPLRAACWWFLVALFPATLIALHGSRVYLYWLPLVVLIAAEWTARSSAKSASSAVA